MPCSLIKFSSEDCGTCHRMSFFDSKVADELGSGQIGIDENLGKVSVVGTGMQDSPGYAAKMFKTLATSGINIEMITTSEIRITCIVKVSELGKAASALHDAFEMDFN